MADPLLLSLRPSIVPSPSNGSLQVRIAQINKQKGAFRHVTEASLLEEINRDGLSDSDMDMEHEGSEEALKPEDRQALLWKGREAMLRQIDHARNETLTALDFVSALLSKQVTTAQASMSPILKKAVPVGSLESRTVRHVPTTAPEQRRIDMTRRGWKMDSFASAAEKISAAGLRLHEEAERESRYWDQISNLKAEGWAVSRLPRDSRTVGVHFGFTEAAPAFRNRGFAILRRGQDGNVSLDRSIIPPRPLAVMVTVSVAGEGSGSSAMQHMHVTDETPIEDQILQANRALSEEELFHEVSREGRLLANQGVQMFSTVIKFDVGDKTNIQLCLINPETEPIPATSSTSAEEMANAIALSLRILLAHAHQQNLQRRSNAPPPMTLKARALPEYALLRPVMSHLQHTSSLDNLRAFTASVLLPLSNAGVNASVKFTLLNNLNWPKKLKASSWHAKDLLGPLTVPLESKMSFELPTRRSLDLTIRTFLGSPIFGTEFSVNPISYGTMTLSPPRLETVVEVQKFVCHVIMMDVAVFIEGLHKTSPQVVRQNDAGDTGPTPPAQLSWNVSDIHHGELSLQKIPPATAKLQVRVWQDQLGLRHMANVKKGTGDMVSYVWESDKLWKTTASGRKEVPKQHLAAVVAATLHGTTSVS